MAVKYLNGIPMALVPALGTSATINAADRYAVAAGELAITTDTLRLYLGGSNYAFLKAAGWILPDVVCFDDSVVCSNNEIVWKEYG